MTPDNFFEEEGDISPYDKINQLQQILLTRQELTGEAQKMRMEVTMSRDKHSAAHTFPENEEVEFSLKPDGSLSCVNIDTGRPIQANPEEFTQLVDQNVSLEFLEQQWGDIQKLQQEQGQDGQEPPQEGQGLPGPDNSPQKGEDAKNNDRQGEDKRMGNGNSVWHMDKTRVGRMVDGVKRTGQSAQFKYVQNGIAHTVDITPAYDTPGKRGVQMIDRWNDEQGNPHKDEIKGEQLDHIMKHTSRVNKITGTLKAAGKAAQIAGRGGRSYARKVAQTVTDPQVGFSRM